MSNYYLTRYATEPSQRQLGYGWPRPVQSPYMDCPPDWNVPDEPEPDEPDPVQVARDAAECTAYEAACEYGYAPLYLALRRKARLVPDRMRLITSATRTGGWGLHPGGAY